MSFLFVNQQELNALNGVPHLQRLVYLLGIRPYMDRDSCVVGVKRKISYQSLAEVLYVEPHTGIKSGSPSRQQLRRAVKGLESAGLISIQSVGKQLILKCLLADRDFFVQNKANTKPTHQADTKTDVETLSNSGGCNERPLKTDIAISAKADTPQLSNNLYVCVRERFDKFWKLYPQKIDEARAFIEFKKLNPDEVLLKTICLALEAQIKNRDELASVGEWVPKWKYPANWLAQACWKDELFTVKQQEHSNEKGQYCYQRKSAVDVFAESCQHASLDFDIPDEGAREEAGGENLIPFNKFRR